MQDYQLITKCRFCGSDDLKEYINLGDMPLVNNLLDHPEQEHGKYPLRVFFCRKCTMSQLDCVVEPEVLFGHYLYRSGMSQGFKKHCAQLARDIYFDILKEEESLVVDIASNDGTFLKEVQFFSCTNGGNVNVLGVEPAKNLAKLANDNFVPTLNKFFDYNTAMDVVIKYGKANVITAQNVFAHVHDINGFMSGIHYLLDEKGTFIVECPWAGDLITNADFLNVYHEHCSYISVRGMQEFVKKFGLCLDKIKYFKYMHTGTIRYYIKHEGEIDISNRWEIENVICREERLNEVILYENEWPYSEAKIQDRIEKIKNDLLKEVLKCRNIDGILGVGAAAKATILCNFCNLKGIVTAIADNTPEKQGKFQPGTGIPIVPFDTVKNEKRLMLVMPWNLGKEIAENVRKLNPKADLIVAVPKLENL